MTPNGVDAVDRSAFDLRPGGTSGSVGSPGAAVLCLHGLTGTPYEVRPIAQALAARGLRARAPWMAGHEQGHEALARTRYADWVELAELELAALRAEYAKVFVVGVSMGGLVALRLAETRVVDGIVVIGTPLALRWPLPLLARALRRLVPFRAKRGSDICDPAARARHPGLQAMPLASVCELVRLQAVVAAELWRIHVPILVAHAATTGLRCRGMRPGSTQRSLRWTRSSSISSAPGTSPASTTMVQHSPARRRISSPGAARPIRSERSGPDQACRARRAT